MSDFWRTKLHDVYPISIPRAELNSTLPCTCLFMFAANYRSWLSCYEILENSHSKETDEDDQHLSQLQEEHLVKPCLLFTEISCHHRSPPPPGPSGPPPPPSCSASRWPPAMITLTERSLVKTPSPLRSNKGLSVCWNPQPCRHRSKFPDRPRTWWEVRWELETVWPPRCLSPHWLTQPSSLSSLPAVSSPRDNLTPSRHPDVILRSSSGHPQVILMSSDVIGYQAEMIIRKPAVCNHSILFSKYTKGYTGAIHHGPRKGRNHHLPSPE